MRILVWLAVVVVPCLPSLHLLISIQCITKKNYSHQGLRSVGDQLCCIPSRRRLICDLPQSSGHNIMHSKSLISCNRTGIPFVQQPPTTPRIPSPYSSPGSSCVVLQPRLRANMCAYRTELSIPYTRLALRQPVGMDWTWIYEIVKESLEQNQSGVLCLYCIEYHSVFMFPAILYRLMDALDYIYSECIGCTTLIHTAALVRSWINWNWLIGRPRVQSSLFSDQKRSQCTGQQQI